MSVSVKYIGPFYRVVAEGETFVSRELKEVAPNLAERLLKMKEFDKEEVLVPVEEENDN